MCRVGVLGIQREENDPEKVNISVEWSFQEK